MNRMSATGVLPTCRASRRPTMPCVTTSCVASAHHAVERPTDLDLAVEEHLGDLHERVGQVVDRHDRQANAVVAKTRASTTIGTRVDLGHERRP